MRLSVVLALFLAGCGGTHHQAAAPTATPRPMTLHRHDRRHRVAVATRTTVARAAAVQQGPAAEHRIAITFDADMTPEMLGLIESGHAPEQIDRRLITTLRRTHTPATMFLTGMWARRYRSEVRTLAREGFELGNHTWDHRAWTAGCYGLAGGLTTATGHAEVTRTASLLRRLTGKRPIWFRFPGLCHRPEALRVVAAEHEQAVDGIPSGDAFQRDPAAIVRTVLSQVRPGSIIVMHMMGPPNAPATAQALTALIPRLRARGYRLTTVGRLLGAS